MRKFVLLFTINLLFFPLCFAQYPDDIKCANIWLMGRNEPITNENVMKLDFNTNPTTYTTLTNPPLKFTNTSTGICTQNGNLLFYANEDKIIDSTYQIIQNGSGLNTAYSPYTGVSYIQGGIMLRLPNTNKCIYIHQGYNLGRPRLPIKKDTLLITTIDMDGNNGRGSVISKNIPFFTNYSHTLSFKVCRHANGRDWWFIQPDTTYNTIHRFLITPHGIDTLAPQIMQNPPLPPNSWSNHTAFSPNGDKWATRFADDHTILVYDFDRCTGLLSNYTMIDRDFGTTPGYLYGGIAFSPNSRFLYHSRPFALFQYDLNSTDINASGFPIAGGTTLSQCTPRLFTYSNSNLPILGYMPNNTLVIPSNQLTNKLHAIANPDGNRYSSDIRLCNIILPSEYLSQVLPNFPNYRLGPVDGSACDTLGIDNIVSTESIENKIDAINIYPNPTSGNIIIDNITENATLQILNVLGQAVHTQNLNTGKNIFNLSLEAGTYFVHIQGQDSTLLNTKLTIIK